VFGEIQLIESYEGHKREIGLYSYTEEYREMAGYTVKAAKQTPPPTDAGEGPEELSFLFINCGTRS
jgi:hypothetical protein